MVYGTVKPLSSWNPLWANLINWVQLGRMARATQRWPDKIKVWFAPPEWRPKDLGGSVEVPDATRAGQTKYRTTAPKSLDWYVVASFAYVGGLSSIFLLLQETLSWGQLLAFGAVLIAALTAWGGLLEVKPWGKGLDLLRHAASPAVAAWLAHGTDYFLPAVVVTSAAALGFALWLRSCPTK